MTLKQVVLPAPLGPMRPRISPSLMWKFTSLRATTPPKRRVTLSTSSRRRPARVGAEVAAEVAAAVVVVLVSGVLSGIGRPLLECDGLVRFVGRAEGASRGQPALGAEDSECLLRHAEG